jgi:hypothetical protein
MYKGCIRNIKCRKKNTRTQTQHIETRRDKAQEMFVGNTVS